MLPLHGAETNQFKGSIFSNIEGLEEFDEFLTKLNNYFAPKIYYHTDCRVHFNNDVSSKRKSSSKSHWHYNREYHRQVFTEIGSIIEENIIKKGRCYLLTHLYELYIESLEKLYQDNSVEMNFVFTAHHLEEKNMKVYGKDIKFLRFVIKN